jgi:ribonucleoside-diphosphate reductase alpha chain
VYSDVPYSQISLVREKNRRLGLGLMGLHEWLLTRGKRYGPDPDLEGYLREYAQSTEVAAKWADQWDLSRPKKTRAIAPTGTISIIAETSSGIEPIFCTAYKRRYLKGSAWNYQYVIDPVAKKLVDSGVRPENIEDSYTLAEDIERRLGFQAWVQQYVDHAISSTINLPAWGSPVNNEDKAAEIGQIIFKYLPKLKGLTLYPEGARGGQPLVPVQFATALKHLGEIFVEGANVCSITGRGSCGE